MNISSASAQVANRVAGLLILVEVVTVLIPVYVLGKYFEFPDVLRQPAAYGLALFRRHQAQIVPAYYVFMVSGLLYIPLSYAFAAALQSTALTGLRQALVGAGIATAVFQAIGFSRWLFIVPYLAEQLPQHPDQQATIALVYETLNRYAGMTIGEHLGFLAMGTWTLLLATLLSQESRTDRWFAIAGFPIGIGLIVSVAEHFGSSLTELYGIINFIANALWSIWMLTLGSWLLVRRPVQHHATATQSEFMVV